MHLDLYFENVLEVPLSGNKKLTISKKHLVSRMKSKNANGNAKFN